VITVLACKLNVEKTFQRATSAVSFLCLSVIILHSQKKGTKAVTGAVLFQKENFCPFYVLICTFYVLISTF